MITGIFALNASQQTASRLTWSFARDDALILSSKIGKLNRGLGVPVWGLIFNSVVVFIIGCVYLGSTTGNPPFRLDDLKATLTCVLSL